MGAAHSGVFDGVLGPVVVNSFDSSQPQTTPVALKRSRSRRDSVELESAVGISIVTTEHATTRHPDAGYGLGRMSNPRGLAWFGLSRWCKGRTLLPLPECARIVSVTSAAA